jgi:hypothetical protein
VGDSAFRRHHRIDPPAAPFRCHRQRRSCLDAEARLHIVGLIAALPVLVRLSSERERQAVRQDCSFAKKQKSPPTLLVVVRSGRLMDVRANDRTPSKSRSPFDELSAEIRVRASDPHP